MSETRQLAALQIVARAQDACDALETEGVWEHDEAASLKRDLSMLLEFVRITPPVPAAPASSGTPTCARCGHERRNDPNGLGFDCTNPACINFPYITEQNKGKHAVVRASASALDIPSAPSSGTGETADAEYDRDFATVMRCVSKIVTMPDREHTMVPTADLKAFARLVNVQCERLAAAERQIADLTEALNHDRDALAAAERERDEYRLRAEWAERSAHTRGQQVAVSAAALAEARKELERWRGAGRVLDMTDTKVRMIRDLTEMARRECITAERMGALAPSLLTVWRARYHALDQHIRPGCELIAALTRSAPPEGETT